MTGEERKAKTNITVTGHVFNDLDGNGEWNFDEVRLKGRIIFADVNDNGVRDADEPFAKSKADGTYTLKNLPLGDYDLISEIKHGWRATSPMVEGYGYDAAEARYHFLNVAKAANLLSFGNIDNDSATFTPSRDLTFYGEAWSGFQVSTNGFLTFVDYKADAVPGSVLPDEAWPNAVISPLGADFTLGTKGAVYAFDDTANGRVVIEWKNVTLVGDTSGQTSTFEAILGDDGSIKFMYAKVADAVRALIGVENSDGTDGTQILAGSAPADGSGYLFAPAEDRYGVAHAHFTTPGGTYFLDFGQTKGAFGPDQAASLHGGAFHELTGFAAIHDGGHLALA